MNKLAHSLASKFAMISWTTSRWHWCIKISATLAFKKMCCNVFVFCIFIMINNNPVKLVTVKTGARKMMLKNTLFYFQLRLCMYSYIAWYKSQCSFPHLFSNRLSTLQLPLKSDNGTAELLPLFCCFPLVLMKNIQQCLNAYTHIHTHWNLGLNTFIGYMSINVWNLFTCVPVMRCLSESVCCSTTFWPAEAPHTLTHTPLLTVTDPEWAESPWALFSASFSLFFSCSIWNTEEESVVVTTPPGLLWTNHFTGDLDIQVLSHSVQSYQCVSE